MISFLTKKIESCPRKQMDPVSETGHIILSSDTQFNGISEVLYQAGFLPDQFVSFRQFIPPMWCSIIVIVSCLGRSLWCMSLKQTPYFWLGWLGPLLLVLLQVTQLLSIQTKYIAVINASIPTASWPRLIQWANGSIIHSYWLAAEVANQGLIGWMSLRGNA